MVRFFKQPWAERANTRLERYLPEQRLFLKSSEGTRFVRLKPTTQALILTGSSMMICWTILVSAAFFFNTISAGNNSDQVARSQALYEDRLNTLSHERDARAREAEQAHERFYVALEQVSKMQSELLRSEERRRELETGVEVIQQSLRDMIQQRDAAREAAAVLQAELESSTGSKETQAQQAADMEITLTYLADTLDQTSLQRDEAVQVAGLAEADKEKLESTIETMVDRNAQIFSKLEEAVDVSIQPLRKVFTAAGMPPDRIIEEVRRGYSGQGGPLAPISFSTRGDSRIDRDTDRANGILQELQRVDVYRQAAEKSPLAHPVNGPFRKTSGFGPRWGRMHNGLDFAGPHGTDIVATADGVVTHAGWGSGYGKLIKIRHAFGFETRYAHLTRIRVSVGQRVSRGQHIGDMGNTGRSTGTHLHYEIRSNGRPLNPQPFVTAGENVF